MGTHSIHIILDDKEYKILTSIKKYKSWKDFIFDIVLKMEDLTEEMKQNIEKR